MENCLQKQLKALVSSDKVEEGLRVQQVQRVQQENITSITVNNDNLPAGSIKQSAMTEEGTMVPHLYPNLSNEPMTRGDVEER